MQANYQSWFTELGQFPKLCIIVAELDKVTLYDGKDGSEWMVFTALSDRMFRNKGDGVTSITMLNGILYGGVTTGSGDFKSIEFINDTANYKTDGRDRVWVLDGIANRNIDNGYSSSNIGSDFIVNAFVNDVACISDGNMNNTVAVATDGGVSVIHPDGSVNDSQSTTEKSFVDFQGNVLIFSNRAVSATWITDSYLSDGFAMVASYNTTGFIPALPTNSTSALNIKAHCSGSELVLFKHNLQDTTQSMVAYTTADYCSGYMQGDIKGCFLANSRTVDRSVNDEGLDIHGTITEAPVATGAELMGYSGFLDNTNFLRQPYNSDLDFGTTDFYMMGWVKTSSNGRIIDRANIIDNSCKVTLDVDANLARIYMFNSSLTMAALISSSLVTNNTWHFICGYRIDDVLYISVDGITENNTICTYDIINTAQITTIGASNLGTVSLENGVLALIRAGKGAPTAQQIKEIYDAERPLFQENARCLLQGSSSDVRALDYDESTGLLTVCTTDHITKFNGLVVASDEALVATSVSTTSNKEVYGT